MTPSQKVVIPHLNNIGHAFGMWVAFDNFDEWRPESGKICRKHLTSPKRDVRLLPNQKVEGGDKRRRISDLEGNLAELF
jgi:hypothetical protein